MPFIGQDWRAPGETWVRTVEGWERMILRPIAAIDQLLLGTSPDSMPSALSPSKQHATTGASPTIASLRDRSSSCSLSSGDEDVHRLMRDVSGTELDFDMEQEEDWRPHCFVKTGKSKEVCFVGNYNISIPVRRLYEYERSISSVESCACSHRCAPIQLHLQGDTNSCSRQTTESQRIGTQECPMHCRSNRAAQSVAFHYRNDCSRTGLESDSQLKTARELVNDFMLALDSGHHCGSPKLLVQHQTNASGLFDLLTDRQPLTPADSSEDSVTFLDLPRECLAAILRRLPDHVSLLEAAKAHEALDLLIVGERRIWHGLCQFHFTPEQIDMQLKKCPIDDTISWRHIFFELKKYFGMREVYADMIHICCHCKALFWKDHGHPCVSRDAPSVRVTPQQFVDMLLFL